jgi:hypothetical protein
MSAVKTPVLPASEVAFILRRKIGPQRAWGDFLADCIRGRADFYGLTLLPTARVRYRGLDRPVYSVREVHEFVHEAIRLSPPLNSPASLMTYLVDFDLIDYRHWKLRTLMPL